jgi:hypothetical protein
VSLKNPSVQSRVEANDHNLLQLLQRNCNAVDKRSKITSPKFESQGESLTVDKNSWVIFRWRIFDEYSVSQYFTNGWGIFRIVILDKYLRILDMMISRQKLWSGWHCLCKQSLYPSKIDKIRQSKKIFLEGNDRMAKELVKICADVSFEHPMARQVIRSWLVPSWKLIPESVQC